MIILFLWNLHRKEVMINCFIPFSYMRCCLSQKNKSCLISLYTVGIRYQRSQNKLLLSYSSYSSLMQIGKCSFFQNIGPGQWLLMRIPGIEYRFLSHPKVTAAVSKTHNYQDRCSIQERKIQEIFVTICFYRPIIYFNTVFNYMW